MDLVQSLRETVANDPDGKLPLKQRASLLRLLGPVELEGGFAVRKEPLCRRLALAASSVLTVRPVWDARGGGTLLGDCVTAAIGVVEGSVTIDEAHALFGASRRDVLNLVYSQPGAPHVYAGMAAYKLVRLSYSDEDILRLPTLPESELDLDPDLLDVAFCASMAAAGGAWWERIGAESRRVFWLTYLDSAARVLEGKLGPRDLLGM